MGTRTRTWKKSQVERVEDLCFAFYFCLLFPLQIVMLKSRKVLNYDVHGFGERSQSESGFYVLQYYSSF